MKKRYCESTAIGMNAPKCSEDCCDYGSCHKDTYFKHIADKYNTTIDKIDTSSNLATIKLVVDGKEYTAEDIFRILKNHKEEDKKYHKCERCGKQYLGNNTFNMVTHNLDKKPDKDMAWGYASTPYIRGIRILSTCGDGRDISLCDDCIFELKKWLTETVENKSKSSSVHVHYE